VRAVAFEAAAASSADPVRLVSLARTVGPSKGMEAPGARAEVGSTPPRSLSRSVVDHRIELQLVRPHLVLSNTPIRARFRSLIEETVRDFAPDVVVAHGPVPFPLEMAARALRRSPGTAFVPVLHAGQLGGRGLLGLLGDADRATFFGHAMRRADRIVVVASYISESLLGDHGSKVRVVPPGVDLDRFRPGPEGPPDTVLFVGRLEPAYRWKGFHILFEAARLARIEVVVAGAGSEAPAWRQRARAQDVRLHLLGRVPEEGLADAFFQASMVALPSVTDSESFGMVLSEGNACGRAAVGSDIGGIPSFIRPYVNGILVPPGNAAVLARDLRWMADNPAATRRMGLRGRALVEAQYGWPAIVTQFEAVLKEAIEERLEPWFPWPEPLVVVRSP
jgi:glycosyltransferase involved in cell wall biosynthesis